MIAKRHVSPSPAGIQLSSSKVSNRQKSKNKWTRSKTISKNKEEPQNGIVNSHLHHRQKVLNEFTNKNSSLHFAPKLDPIIQNIPNLSKNLNDISIRSSPRYDQSAIHDDDYHTDTSKISHIKRLSSIKNQGLSSISSNVNQRMEFSQSPLRNINKGG